MKRLLLLLLLMPTLATAQGVSGGIATVLFGAGAPGNPCAGTRRLYVDTNNGDLYDCPASTNWTKVTGGAASAALNTLTSAIGANTLTNGDNAQVWQWKLTTASKSAFTISETTASTSTGTPILLNINTLSASTLLPLQVTAQGTSNGVQVTTAGLLQAIGTGGISATQVNAAAVPTSATLLASNGSKQLAAAALTSAHLYVGNGSNLPVDVAVTGDVSITNAGVTALGNIPSATPMAGSLLATAIAAPGTPAAGKGSIYVDSTSKNISVKDDAGVVKHGVQTDTGTANNYISAIADTGAITKSRPACATLSDSSGGCTMSTTAGGDLSGTLPSPTVAKVNGVTYPSGPSTNTVPVITASNTTTYETMPDCQDTGGNHINFTQSSHLFSCGTTGGGGGGAGGGVNAQTTNYTAVSGDTGKLITMNGTSLTLTLPSPASSSTWFVLVENLNATALTISRNGLTINGGTTNITLPQGQWVRIYTDGTNYFASYPDVNGTGLSLADSTTGRSWSVNTSTIASVTGLQQGNVLEVLSVTGNDSYSGSPSTGCSNTSLTNGMVVHLVADVPNVGAASLNFCGLGIVSIKLSNGTTDPNNGDVPALIDTVLTYDQPNNVYRLPSVVPSTSGACPTCVTSAASLTSKGVVIGQGGQAAATIDFPHPFEFPSANCVSGTAGSAWNTSLSPACFGGSNNLGGYLPMVDSDAAQFSFQIPGDWDTASQPYVKVAFTSLSNTTGTVIFNVATACSKEDGSVTSDPSFTTADALATKTMAAASRFWDTTVQMTHVTSGNNCVPGGVMLVKVTRATDTASTAVGVEKVVLTVPRLLTVQAN